MACGGNNIDGLGVGLEGIHGPSVPHSICIIQRISYVILPTEFPYFSLGVYLPGKADLVPLFGRGDNGPSLGLAVFVYRCAPPPSSRTLADLFGDIVEVTRRFHRPFPMSPSPSVEGVSLPTPKSQVSVPFSLASSPSNASHSAASAAAQPVTSPVLSTATPSTSVPTTSPLSSTGALPQAGPAASRPTVSARPRPSYRSARTAATNGETLSAQVLRDQQWEASEAPVASVEPIYQVPAAPATAPLSPPSRFQRTPVASVQAHQASALASVGELLTSGDPPSAAQWLLWGVSSPPPAAPDPPFADALMPSGWVLRPCPKCAARPDAPSAPSLMVHPSGVLWCAVCGFNGHASRRPSAYAGTWLSAWRLFLTDTCWSPVCPRALRPRLDPVGWATASSLIAPSTPELPDPFIPPSPPAGVADCLPPQEPASASALDDSPLPLDLGSSVPAAAAPLGLDIGTPGCWAPGWTGSGWEMAWHAWAMDENAVIQDAYAFLPSRAAWVHPSHAPTPYPLGWGSLVESLAPSSEGALSRVILVSQPEDFWALRRLGLSEAVCLPPNLDAGLPTARAWRVLDVMEKTLALVRSITIAFRATPADRALEEELGRRMDRERCDRVRWLPPGQEGEPPTASGAPSLSASPSLDWNALVAAPANAAADPLPQNQAPSSSVEGVLGSESFDPDSMAAAEVAGALAAWSRYGAEPVRVMVDAARPFPVAGIHEFSEVEDRFDDLYRTGLRPGFSTGWPSVDPFYTVKPGQWTMLTGIPGHGKSSWLDGLMVNMAEMNNWRFGVFSPENQPVERHFASLLEKRLAKPFSRGQTTRISTGEKNLMKRWLDDHFKMILPDEENGSWTLDSVLRLAKLLVYRHGIRGLIIDPWNELDHSRSASISETQHISECLTKIRRFARLYDVHVWIVAHPTKLMKNADGKYPVPTPYDVSGGANWRNKADNAISIYRNPDEEDFDITDIYVQKIRFREVGSIGLSSLRTDRASGAYFDDIDQNKRQRAIAAGLHPQSLSMRIPIPRTVSREVIPVLDETELAPF